MNKLAISSLFFIIYLLVSGCAKNAPANMQAQSKSLKPEKGLALIYVIRPKSNGGKFMKLPLAFRYNGEKIGTLWAGQYLYFNAKPMKMIFNGEGGKVLKLNISAGKTYFLEYIKTAGVAISLGGNKSLPVTRVMHYKKGRELVNKYRLTGKLNLVTIDKSGTNIKPQPYKQKNKPVKTRHAYRSTNKMATENAMAYNDTDKTGSVTIAKGSRKRRDAIRMIESLCSTKNIALKVGSSKHNKGATYTTMDETLSNGKFTIQFACSY
jgi:hypothetical protein